MADVNNFKRDLEEASRKYSEGDFRTAFDKYLKLAKDGHNDSQVFVGWMLEEGIGVSKNSESAAEWFKRSASLGSIQGSFYYALYLIKHGKQKEAFEWIEKAALKGDIPSIFRLGYMYVHGNGTNINMDKGLYHLEFAAKSNHIYAMRELAVLDMKGYRGVVKRLLSPFKFIYTLCLGFVTVMNDQYSENLRR